MSVVKEGMAHGDLSLDSYCTVWEECLSQVIKINERKQPRIHEVQQL
jgi:pre-mRNA-splicing factor CDC5/CEF1